jgi:hypothetical protein
MNFYQIRYYIIFSERIEWYLKAISNVKNKKKTPKFSPEFPKIWNPMLKKKIGQ